MSALRVDVAILGSGFGGSLLAMILQKLGHQCALIDKGSHPRFAIGESSTPLADFVLSDLARRYELQDVLPLASFGSWQEKYPQLNCGLKRGFSYFHHSPGQTFRPGNGNANQLLVAASSDNHDSDTHWYRADVDNFLFRQARELHVECFENAGQVQIERGTRWRVGLTDGREVECDCVVDASGAAGVLLNHLQVGDATRELQTNSRAIYGHFEDVRRFEEALGTPDTPTDAHPYRCDDAALHHVFDGGWMWNLRFVNDIVSAGICFDAGRGRAGADPSREWEACIEQHPSIATQFAAARVRTDVGLHSSGRLQRLRSQAAETGWFALPNTVGSIDPLHSTGIAHTLSAIERIARMFERNSWDDAAVVRRYDESIRAELRFVDRLVSGCYQSLGRPRVFNAWCMLYFAAAHSCEMRRVGGELDFEHGFLGALIPGLKKRVSSLQLPLSIVLQSSNPDDEKTFEQTVARAIEPFNAVGLLDPAVENMYANTAPPRNLARPSDR